MTIIEKVKGFGKYLALGLASLYTFSAAPTKAIDLSPKPAKILQLDKPSLELKLESPQNGLEQKFLPKFNPIYEVDNPEVTITKQAKIENDDIDWVNYFVEVPLNLGLSYVTTVLAHEFGHATTAKILGLDGVKIHGPELSKGLIASYSYIEHFDKPTSKFNSNLIAINGTGTTSMLSELFYQALKEDQIPGKLKQLTATSSLIMLADRHRYLWSAAIKNFLRMAPLENGDMDAMMKVSLDDRLQWENLRAQGFINNDGLCLKDKKGKLTKFRFYADKEGKFRKLIKQHDPETLLNPMPKKLQKRMDIAYGVALGMSVLELGLKWEQIAFLTQTALGMDAKKPESFDVIKSGFYPLPGGGLFISIDGTW